MLGMLGSEAGSNPVNGAALDSGDVSQRSGNINGAGQ
jgi:hypothetical protein